MTEKQRRSQQDDMKWYMLGVSSFLFAVAEIVKLFKPATEINTLSNVFLGVCGLVLGATVANYFKKGDVNDKP